ncbi:MAG TPA: DUF4350 domain-containing protein [Candidatus Acidoferrales bacterium]|nr:DUF4350 domain-containing protein [Candidatus Acidoferrales bacterium]
MSGSLDRSDRALLIAAGALLLVVVAIAALLGPPQIAGSSSLPSSYSPAWGGAKAAFLLLESLGYRVERWEQPLAQLAAPAGRTVLILADPTMPPGEEDRLAIRKFLEAGGTVLATGSAAARFLPGAAPFLEGDIASGWQSYPATIPSPLVRDAPAITMEAPYQWNPPSLDEVVVYGDASTAAVVAFPYGRGRVVWWAAPTPLTNGGMRQPGNLALLLNSLGSPESAHVLWDEYDHGVRGSLWAFFQPTPVPWMLLQCGLVFLALLATYSRRQGPARNPEKPSRLSPLEFVETMGDLYRAARAGWAAVEIASERLRFLLTRQLALPAKASAAQISRHAGARLGWDEPALLALLSRSERAGGAGALDDAAALELVREIHRSIARLEIGHRKEN